MLLHKALSRSPPGSLQQGFLIGAKGERGLLPGKLPTFLQRNFLQHGRHFLEHDQICQPTKLQNL